METLGDLFAAVCVDHAVSVQPMQGVCVRFEVSIHRINVECLDRLWTMEEVVGHYISTYLHSLCGRFDALVRIARRSMRLLLARYRRCPLGSQVRVRLIREAFRKSTAL